MRQIDSQTDLSQLLQRTRPCYQSAAIVVGAHSFRAARRPDMCESSDEKKLRQTRRVVAQDYFFSENGEHPHLSRLSPGKPDRFRRMVIQPQRRNIKTITATIKIMQRIGKIQNMPHP